MRELETNIGTREYRRRCRDRADELVARCVHSTMTQDVWVEVWDATRGILFTPTFSMAETVDSALKTNYDTLTL